MKLKNPFRDLTRFELMLWLASVCVILSALFVPGAADPLTLAASLIGVTALIFIAKGYVFGQVLTVAFSVFYGIISFFFRYYGEMITYLCMTAPVAALSVISWVRHPYGETKEVAVSRLTPRRVLAVIALSIVVTIAFYFILRALGTANLLFSTLSVATSFAASSLSFLRSPYYALGYSANDVVLIVLWVMAAMEDPAYFPMVLCFVMFLANDLYGFFNWRKMQRRQHMEKAD